MPSQGHASFRPRIPPCPLSSVFCTHRSIPDQTGLLSDALALTTDYIFSKSSFFGVFMCMRESVRVWCVWCAVWLSGVCRRD